MALLPDPTPRERQHILISVDDHVIEPPGMFDGRLPAALADRAPRIVETDSRQVWRYEDREYPNIGLNAVIGRPKEEWSMEAARFDEMRRGCWDIDARIAALAKIPYNEYSVQSRVAAYDARHSLYGGR